MDTKDLATTEAQVVADLRRRHNSGDNEAAKILLEHIRAKQAPMIVPEIIGTTFRQPNNETLKKCRSAMYCNHANEAPAQCPCDADCYCRVEGNCPTILP